jgi:hypothetical protein
MELQWSCNRVIVIMFLNKTLKHNININII